jgi:hypothetical protein
MRWASSIFNVHSRVRARTKHEAERVGKYMVRPVVALERLTFLEPEGKVGYRWGWDAADPEAMDYLEFIARVTAHIPDKGQVMVRYYGLYAMPTGGRCGSRHRHRTAGAGAGSSGPHPMRQRERIYFQGFGQVGLRAWGDDGLLQAR